MIPAETVRVQSFHALNLLKRCLSGIFRQRSDASLDYRHFSEHLRRDLGILDGDRSDG
jgi:hypothetical protein